MQNQPPYIIIHVLVDMISTPDHVLVGDGKHFVVGDRLDVG